MLVGGCSHPVAREHARKDALAPHAGHELAAPAAGDSVPPGSTTVTADWDDTEAAVVVGAESIESVIHQTEDVSPTHRRYTLRLNSGESATLDITRTTPPPSGITGAATEPPVELTLTARVGLAGDRARERRLVDAVSRRLGQLKGVGAARIR